MGFLNDLFYDRSHIAGPAEMSIPLLLDEKPTVIYRAARLESGRDARGQVRYGAARSDLDRQRNKDL
jgi:hypothetical protein